MSTSRRHASAVRWARIVGALLLGAILLAPGRAAAQRAVQTTPDQNMMLVNKDVGGERWSIALNLRDGTAIGNVFPTNGGAPSFVWCSASGVQLAPNPVDAQYKLDCFGASPCGQLPCLTSSWTFIQTVTLSGSFFFQP